MNDHLWVLLTIWEVDTDKWGTYVWYWEPKTGYLRGSRKKLFRIKRQIWGSPL